jgi:hypothetical protein
MKTRWIWSCFTAASLWLLASCPSSKSEGTKLTTAVSAGEAAPTDGGAAPFTVCYGTYALCTTSLCSYIPGSDGGVGAPLSCPCSVQHGYSAGTHACKTVPDAGPSPGQAIPSRYYPAKSMAICTNDRPWAGCLDMPCVVGADGGANCACVSAAGQGSYVVVTDSYSDSTCTTGVVSSATACDSQLLTTFLAGTPLKPFPIKVVNNAPVTLCLKAP